MDAYIAGTGAYIPPRSVSNLDLYSRIQNFNVERARHSLEKRGHPLNASTDAEVFDLWVQQVCGIKKRSFIPPDFAKESGLVVEEMAAQASFDAIRDAGLEVDEIQHLVFSSYSSDVLMPGPVSGLAKILGMKNISGVNINGACNGFLDGLLDASAKVAAGLFDNVLVVASEYLSNKVDFGDPTTSILFSDGAGAWVIRRGQRAIHGFSISLKFSRHIAMQRGGYVQMDGGPLVHRKAVQSMCQVTKEVLEKNNLSLADCAYIIPHQANLRILNAFEESMDVPPSTTLIKCIDELGNLSSATIPVAVDYLRRGRLNTSYRKNARAILTAIGGGYAYGAAIVDLP